jgi:hypothetical protein
LLPIHVTEPLRCPGALEVPSKAQCVASHVAALLLSAHYRLLPRNCAPCSARSSRLCTRSPPSTSWTGPYLMGPPPPPTTCPCTAVRPVEGVLTVQRPWTLSVHRVEEGSDNSGAVNTFWMHRFPGGAYYETRRLSSVWESPFSTPRLGCSGCP